MSSIEDTVGRLVQLAEGQKDEQALDEMVHDVASQGASNINNAGYETQIRYLLASGLTMQEIAKRLVM